MGNTYVVGNAAELTAATNKVQGGDTIVLKGGNYGNFSWWDKYNTDDFSPAVKIVSQSSDNPAVFSSIAIRDVGGLHFDNIKVDYTSKYGSPIWESPFTVYHSKNIKITNSTFDGDVGKGLSAVDNGFGVGRALFVNSSSNIEVSGNKFVNFHRGIVVSDAQNVKVTGNEISKMSSDGMNFSETKGVEVSGNHLHDFLRSPLSSAHADMIQFNVANGNTPSSDIKITNNYLDSAAGSYTQSIFLFNESAQNFGKGQEFYYRNIEISNNLIRNGHSHGITVGEAIGVKIDNNTLISNVFGDFVSAPAINVYPKAQGVTITDNLTTGMTAKLQSGWTMSNNYFMQTKNPAGADYVGKIFVDPFDRFGASINDFKFLPGADPVSKGVGSALSLGGGLSGQIVAKTVDGENTLSQKFDASYVIPSGSKVNLSGAKITWDFGDGTTGTGLVAQHEYTKSGAFTATVKIVLANGQVITADKTFVLKNSDVLDMDFANGIKDNSAVDSPVSTVNGPPKVITLSNGNKVLDLNKGSVSIKTDSEFFNNTEYTFVADFKKAAGTEAHTGRLAYFNGSLIVTVMADGIEAIVRTSKGTEVLKAHSLGIKDTDWHRVGVTFSSETGFARLFVDGKEVASVDGLEGAFQQGTRGATFNIGGAFGQNFSGMVDNVHFQGDEFSLSKIMSIDPHPTGSNFTPAAALAKAAAAMAPSSVEDYVGSKAAAPHAGTDTTHTDTIAPPANWLSSAAGDSDFRLL